MRFCCLSAPLSAPRHAHSRDFCWGSRGVLFSFLKVELRGRDRRLDVTSQYAIYCVWGGLGVGVGERECVCERERHLCHYKRHLCHHRRCGRCFTRRPSWTASTSYSRRTRRPIPWPSTARSLARSLARLICPGIFTDISCMLDMSIVTEVSLIDRRHLCFPCW